MKQQSHKIQKQIFNLNWTTVLHFDFFPFQFWIVLIKTVLLTNDTEVFCTSSNFQIWKVFKKNREKTYRNVNAVFVGYMCPENVFEAYVWVLKKIAFTILMNNLRVITNKYLSILHLSIYRIVDAPLAEVVLWLSSSNGTIVKFCHRSATSLALWPSSTIILRKVVHCGWFSILYSMLLNVT